LAYALNRSDAHVTRRGRFKWKSTTVAINGSKESFKVTVTDRCGFSRTIMLSVS